MLSFIKYQLFGVAMLLSFLSDAQAQTRNNAGLQGSEGAVSGFFETVNPVNYPTNLNEWWHLLDVRHSNTANNFAMQFSGRFYDQELFFRKTADNASQPWSKVLLETNGQVGIGTTSPENIDSWERVLEVKGIAHAKSVVSSSDIQTGIWSHVLGYYGAPAGGITGTSTNHPFSIITNKSTKMTIASNGDVGIGTITPKEKLSVNGKIRAHEIKVERANWPDYVFAKDYQLPSLEDTEKCIKEKGHLPGIPSAEEVKSNGIDLGDMNAKLLQKIEELTLQLIEVNKEVKLLKSKMKK